MKRSLMSIVMVLVTSLTLSAQTEMIHGTVKTVEKSTSTVTVATDDGAETVLHFTEETVVHPTDKGTKDVWHGLKAGTKVAVHYTDVAARKTAVEVYDLTKTGLKATAGAVVSVDRATAKVRRQVGRRCRARVCSDGPGYEAGGHGDGQGRGHRRQGHRVLHREGRQEDRAVLQGVSGAHNVRTST